MRVRLRRRRAVYAAEAAEADTGVGTPAHLEPRRRLELLHAREHLLLLLRHLPTALLLLLQRGLLRLQQRLHERGVLLDERGLLRL